MILCFSWKEELLGTSMFFVVFSEIFNLIQECAEEKHKFIGVPFMPKFP